MTHKEYLELLSRGKRVKVSYVDEDTFNKRKLLHPALISHYGYDPAIESYCIADANQLAEAHKRTLNHKYGYRMAIRKVIFNDPATIVLWKDGTKTVVKCGEQDIYDPEKGLAMAISKRALGDRGNYYETFKKWLPKEEESSKEEECSDSVQKAIDNIKKKVRETLGGIYNIEQEEEKKYTVDEIVKAFNFNETYAKFRLKQYEESRQ